MGAVLAKKTGMTLYAQVSDALEREIENGKYPIGQLLPTESELQKIYGVSKFTIREALRRLEELGLLQKRHGIGSCVMASRAEHQTVFAIDDFDDFMRFAHRAPLKKLSVERRALNADETLGLGLGEVAQYVIVTGVRRLPSSSEITAYVKIYLAKRFGSIVARIGSNPNLVSMLIEKHFGVSTNSIRQEISAPMLEPDVLKQLRPSKNAGIAQRALLFRRWHLTAEDDLLMCSENFFLNPEFAFNFRLVRQNRST